MKRFIIHIILLSIAVNWTGCTDHALYPHTIQQAEALMNSQPDSALHLLQSTTDNLTMLPDEVQMYYHLLTIQAKDKLYIPHTNDSLINLIVSFYQSSGNKDRLMLAFYYQGSVYRDLNDAPRALKAFQQVLNLGEGLPPCDLFARTYNQMGTLFAHQGMYDESIEANKQSICQYVSQGKKNKISYALRDIARMYDSKRMQDSALHYYQKAYQVALADSNFHRYYSILGEFGGFYYHINKLKSKEILLTVLNEKPKTASINLKIGIIYEEENKLDSAKYYYYRALQYGNLRKQKHAHHHLFQVLMRQNKQQEAMQHYYTAYKQDDSIKQITATEAIAKINALYNYQRTERANIQLQLNQEKQTRTIYLLFFLFILSSSIATTIYFHVQKKHQVLLSKEQMLLKQAKDNYTNSLKQTEDNLKKINILNTLLKENENKSKQLKQELTLAQKELLEKHNALIIASNKEKELSKQVFMESDIYSLFHKAAFTPGLHLSAKEWSSLQRHFHETFPHFLPKLQELYPNPSEHELRICLLLKMGISLTGIANLLNSSKPSITNARTRLYEKIFGKKGKACDLDKFIAEL